MKLELQNEFHALFPRFIKAVGPMKAIQLLQRYSESFARTDWEPIERLRAFPLFLRNERRADRLEKSWWFELALFEWTEFITLYSPISENREASSLEKGQLMLNPTAQILRFDHDVSDWESGEPEASKTMLFFFRRYQGGRFSVEKLAGDWSTAAIADVLLENGRMTETELLREIKEHQGSGHDEAWSEKIDDLISQGLILSSF